MSFWFRKRDKEGRVHYFSVTIPFLVAVVLFGILVAFFLPWLQWLRDCLR